LFTLFVKLDKHIGVTSSCFKQYDRFSCQDQIRDVKGHFHTSFVWSPCSPSGCFETQINVRINLIWYQNNGKRLVFLKMQKTENRTFCHYSRFSHGAAQLCFCDKNRFLLKSLFLRKNYHEELKHTNTRFIDCTKQQNVTIWNKIKRFKMLIRAIGLY